MRSHHLLVVDDEPNICFSLRASLQTSALEVSTASSAKDALRELQAKRPDVLLLDVRLPDMSGLDLYARIRELDSRIPVIIMTAFARTETAIEATRRGAFDYLIKPVDLRRLRDVIGKAIESRRISSGPLLPGAEADELATGDDAIVGLSPPMQEVYKTIGRVAKQDATVLILGESGTGKELVARAVWNYSQRCQMPFLAMNCAALPESLLDSELFGHERGAFTGADQRRIGKFEKVNGGTIFLDEIADMSSATQAKALRLLQQQQFERIGGNTTIQTDVRVIAATNRDIAAMVEEGTFRRDLYYRLNGITIVLPPLRERRDDIPLLARHFLRQLSAEVGRTFQGIAPEVIDRLQEHDWPGNVREFQSALRYAMLHATHDVLTADCLPESCRGGTRATAVAIPAPLPTVSPVDVGGASENAREPAATPASEAPAGPSAIDVENYAKQLLSEGRTRIYREVSSEMDRVLLRFVMNHVGGNQFRAAELLGISRVTLRNKLRSLAGESGANRSQGDDDEDESTQG